MIIFAEKTLFTMTTKQLILSDYQRLKGAEMQNVSIARLAITAIVGRIPAFTYCFWFRIAQNCHRQPLKTIGIVMHHHYTIKYHIDIKRTTKIGPGLYLSHGMCIVINGKTEIGNNVNISQFVNIGSNATNEYATIGNNVYIGPHVSIVGHVTIGDNVTIGAGSVVTKDIPANATAVGVPAKVIGYDKPARYIKNPFTA